ncbi:MBL fold metallo-hydrolase [Rhodovulum visakhapatnamense]|uniref:MBL fold metallo-hydrolase n=1 Tax=Rhodovulum visakhapatnamense TaxID=364297 RepID=A0ABS1RJ57_9RHOB|nr:MBL fold metallo-hydrolase [Rhodovulum visakhapatnamense]MBL3571317.1 MBL fold metallo-hydrolase [Rhodovulum visakhapatnamense]MBL3579544.1 MBL fold metallo-hydrolase [Rhodovulum visakhapatnamense]
MDGSLAPIRTPFEVPPDDGAAVEIAEGVLWLRLPLPPPLKHVNVFALDDGPGWTLVDTGLDTERTRAIWQTLLAGPLGGRPVRRVILTHHHPDHVGLAGWFQSAHGAELWTSRTAWLFARMLTLDEQPLPRPETLEFYRGAGMDAAVLAERAAERPFNFADVVAPMPLGFRALAEGDRISAGGRDWDVRLGDGHAPDHVTLWSRDDALVIGGDQLLPSISPNLGVYATEPLNDPVAGWLESCTRFATHAREDHLVLPGHKLPFTGLPTRLVQLIENHHGALNRLIEALGEERTACDCFPVLYRREIGSGEYGLALAEAVGHLNHLYLTGRATRRRRSDGAWLFRSE